MLPYYYESLYNKCLLPMFRCYFIAQSYLSVKKYKEVLALYERTIDYAHQSLETHQTNKHTDKSKVMTYVTEPAELPFCVSSRELHGDGDDGITVVTAVMGLILFQTLR